LPWQARPVNGIRYSFGYTWVKNDALPSRRRRAAGLFREVEAILKSAMNQGIKGRILEIYIMIFKLK